MHALKRKCSAPEVDSSTACPAYKRRHREKSNSFLSQHDSVLLCIHYLVQTDLLVARDIFLPCKHTTSSALLGVTCSLGASLQTSPRACKTRAETVYLSALAQPQTALPLPSSALQAQCKALPSRSLMHVHYCRVLG